MSPYVSVVLPTAFSNDIFVKLLLPVDAIKWVDSQRWTWIPTLKDAVCDQPVGTLLNMIGVAHRKESSQIGRYIFDFR